MLASTSSLQKLQSLNEHPTNITTAIQDAATLAGLRLDDLDNFQRLWDSSESVPYPSASVRHHARAERVFKWILEKLKSDEDDGRQARTNNHAWSLLLSLIQTVPQTSSTRLLKAKGFLAILSNALQEYKTSLHHVSGTPADGLAQNPKKRKRQGSEAVEFEPSDASLFLIIGTTLKHLTSLSSHSTEGHSTMQTDPPTAAHLLGLWLSVLRLLLEKFGLDQQASAGWLNGMLDPTIQMYERSLEGWASGEDEKESTELFASECLLPAAVLLRALTDGAVAWRPLRRQIESLLARHVLLPGRSSFHQSKLAVSSATPEDAKTASGKNKKTVDEPKLKGGNEEPLVHNRLLLAKGGLNHYLKPLTDALRKTEDGEIEASWPPPGEIRRSLPFLLELAIRASPGSILQKRHAEAPWVEEVFTTLAECVGVDFDLPRLSIRTPATISCIDSLVNTIAAEKRTLTVKTLEALSQFSGLRADSDDPVIWTIVANLIELDAAIFMSAGRSPIQEADSLTNVLFTKVSASEQEEDLRSSNDTRAKNLTLNMGVTGLFSMYIDPFLRDKIVLPLIHSYAKHRRLPEFFGHWNAQLVSCFDYIGSPGAPGVVWAYPDIIRNVGLILESSLTAAQIGDLLSYQIQDITHGCQDPQERRMASLVILDAILGSLKTEEIVDQVEDQLKLLRGAITINLQKAKIPVAGRSRMWRLLARLWDFPQSHQEQADLTGHTYDKSVREPLHLAWQDVEEALSSGGLNESVCGLEALGLIGSISSTVGTSCFDVMDREIAGRTIRLLYRSVPDPILSKPAYEFSDPRTHREKFIFLEHVAVFIQHPNLLRFMNEIDKEQLLLKKLFIYAAIDWTTLDSNCDRTYLTAETLTYVTAETLLDAWVQISTSTRQQSMQERILNICYSALSSLDANDREVQWRVSLFAQKIYLGLPLPIIPRDHREKVLDWIVNLLLNDANLQANTDALFLAWALVTKFMDVPNATAKISTDPETLWRLVRGMEDRPVGDDVLCHAFSEAVKLMLSHLWSTIDQPRSAAYMTKLLHQLRRHLEIDTSANGKETTLQLGEEAPVFALLAKLLLHSVRHAPAADPASSREEASAFSLPSEALLLNATARIQEMQDQRTPDDPDLLFLRRWLRTRCGLVADKSINSDSPNLLDQTILRRAHGEEPDAQELILTLDWSASQLQDEDYSMQDRGMIQMYIGSLFETMPMEVVLELIDHLLPNITSNPGSASLLEFVIDSVWHDNIHVATLEKSGNPIGLLDIPNRVAAALPSVANLRCFHPLMRVVGIMLREKTWLASQWTIDVVLSTLARIASPSGPALPHEHSSGIYISLCDTLQSILSLHRTALGGRYHNLTTIFSLLLDCLFIPETRYTRTSSASLPPWLSPKTQSTDAAVANATAYARLLSTLSSPSVSSVSTRKSKKARMSAKAHLTDEVKRARAYVGQFAPHIVARYCKNQLTGRLQPEVKSALVVGLHSLMDTMGAEAMRAMNEGLDASGRAIWTGVYTEWKRVGRWTEV